MKEVHVLVDLENNQPTLKDVERLVPGLTDIWLFHSKNQVKRLESFESIGDKRTKIPISRPGKNSLDFHLAFYLGYIASKHPTAKLVVMAVDGGYDPMLLHAKQLGFDVAKVPFTTKAARENKPEPAKKAPAAGKSPSAKPASAAIKTALAKKPAPTAKPTPVNKAALARKAAAAKKAPSATKAAPATKVPAKKAAPPRKVSLPKVAAVDLAKLYVKLVSKLKGLGANRATTVNKLRPQIISLLGLKDETGQRAADLLRRLISAGVVNASATGRLQYKFD